jgi:hypothetical protein
MAGMNNGHIVSLCCDGFIFLAFVVVLRQEYFDRPSGSGGKAKRLKAWAYIAITIAYAVKLIVPLVHHLNS